MPGGMVGGKRGKFTQAEMLAVLSPPPFDQRNIVPKSARLVHSPKEKWWRSNSPMRQADRDFSDLTNREGAATAPPCHGTERSGDFDSIVAQRTPRGGQARGFETRGVLGWGRRTGPSCFRSQYQTGSGTTAHFVPPIDSSPMGLGRNTPPSISGYSGFIPGKYAGNVVGATYSETNKGAETHLRKTHQAFRFSCQSPDLGNYNSLAGSLGLSARGRPPPQQRCESAPPGAGPPDLRF